MFISLLILSTIYIKALNASHFRGGSIRATPIKEIGSNLLIEFSISFCWKRDWGISVFCNDTTINSKTLFGPVNNINCISSCTGTSVVIGNTALYCTSYSISDNWSCGQNTFQYSLPQNCSYSASFVGNDWYNFTKMAFI
jgi:hypothetical protein